MKDSVVFTSYDDARAQPMLEAITREYDEIYGDYFGEPAISPYPAEVFAAPDGAFLLIIRGSLVIAGGAFMRFGPTTAELKRVWVHDDFRRQGLARQVLELLETRAKFQGYARLYLTTGFRQPAACSLYLAAGYTPLFNAEDDPELNGGEMPFEKIISY